MLSGTQLALGDRTMDNAPYQQLCGTYLVLCGSYLALECRATLTRQSPACLEATFLCIYH